MIDWSTLRGQTTALRQTLARVLAGEAERADVVPPTWNNNLRWHAGHLVVTPRLLTYGLMREPVGLEDGWRRAFSKGTGPEDWEAPRSLPSLEDLTEELVAGVAPLFEAFADRQEAPFPDPYRTSAGVTLHTPAEALTFSLAHDAMHLGMVLALKRSLDETPAA